MQIMKPHDGKAVMIIPPAYDRWGSKGKGEKRTGGGERKPWSSYYIILVSHIGRYSWSCSWQRPQI